MIDAPRRRLRGPGGADRVALGRQPAEGRRRALAARSPRACWLLDEPFRGVDLGARRDIADRLRELDGDGVVVVASADVDEVLEVADRIVVLADGARRARRARRRAPTASELTLAMNGAA